MEQDQIDEEKKRWEIGVGFGVEGFKVWVAREIDKLGKLSGPSSKGQKRFSILNKKQREELGYRDIREEFRAFLRSTKDTVDLYLWFALSNLAERTVDRKVEAKVYHLFGDVANTFLYIEQNFDPSKVGPELQKTVTDEELSAAIREVQDRVRSRVPQGSLGLNGVTAAELMPLVHARDAAEAKVAAIGTVNPRPPGFKNALIQRS